MNYLRISVVTIVLNGLNVIRNTIESVLNQTYSEIEYFIIDGGSTDGTMDVVEEYKTQIAFCLSEPDHGIYDAMNKAIERANGDFVIFMNAGDTFIVPYILEYFVQSVTLKNAVYYGDALFCNPQNKKLYIYGGKFNCYRFSRENICHQAIFYPAIAYKNQKYNSLYKIGADWVYNLQLIKKEIPFIYLNQLISFFDATGVSMLCSDTNLNRNRKLLIKKNLGTFIYLYWIIKKNIRIRLYLRKIRDVFKGI